MIFITTPKLQDEDPIKFEIPMGIIPRYLDTIQIAGDDKYQVVEVIHKISLNMEYSHTVCRIYKKD